jgi:predicted RNA methylase
VNYTPDAREKLRIVRNNVQMFGARQTMVDALVHLFRRRPDKFDRDHGVSTRLTSGSVLPLEHGIGDAKSVENGHGYEPTDAQVMRHILRFIESSYDVGALSFVDLGSGRGRTLLMASELPFREVIGVELDPMHCDAARENVACYRPRPPRRVRSNVRVCCEDVTHFDYPDSDLLVYMFNPFRGSVFGEVLDNLAKFQRERGRRVTVVLSNPAMEDMLLGHPAFRRSYEFQVIASASSWNLWECDAARPSPRV